MSGTSWRFCEQFNSREYKTLKCVHYKRLRNVGTEKETCRVHLFFLSIVTSTPFRPAEKAS
jgi:hypothetical protein